MTRKTNQSAVLYCRVSTKRQAKEGNGLQSQSTRAREYASHRGHRVIAEFTDDVSGKFSQRPGFDEMLAFIRTKRKLGIVVIIDDISRMARDVRGHFDLKESIFRAGATLESPSIEFGEDSDSILIEHLLASVSQHQRQKNGEQAKNRMRARLQGGYWVFNAPIGYRYQRSPAGGSILVRDEPIASIIADGLEQYASGHLTSQAEVKRFFEAHPQFPICRHGYLTNEQAKRILTNVVYAGYVESKVWGVSLRQGQHEGVISLETFQRVQERLTGKPFAPVRLDINEQFPMRGVVVCGDCNHPLTANFSKGRTKVYPYYICRHRPCEKFGKSVARDKIEGAYEDLLRQMTPSHELVDVFSTLFRKRWDEATGKTKERRTAIKMQTAAVEKKITQLLDRIVESESVTVIGAYERKVEELEREKLVLAEKNDRCGTALPSYDETFRTAFEFLGNPWNLCKSGSLEDKRIVQKLTLASHLEYDWKEGVRTPEISLPFKVLGPENDREKVMAEREGFEPSVPSPARRISSAVQSTTLPPLRRGFPLHAAGQRGTSVSESGRLAQLFGTCKRLLAAIAHRP